MVVRVVQNDQGLLLPPDLVGGAPKQDSSAEAGELITLIDMDHYVEGNFDPDARWVVETAYEMHDQIVETFHEHVVTAEAITRYGSDGDNMRPADDKTVPPIPTVVDYRRDYCTMARGERCSSHGSGYPGGVPGSVEQPSAIVIVIDSRAASTVRVQQEPSALLMSQCHGSAGIVSGSSDYGSLLPHVGSSSLIVDRRSVQRWPWIDARLTADGFESIPVVDQLKELRAALSLNKSQLARIVRVTRPTIYEWYEGKDPNAVNCERIRTLLRVLKRSVVSGAMPLNARFVRQPAEPAEPPLLDLLCEDRLDQARVARAIDRVRGSRRRGSSASGRTVRIGCAHSVSRLPLAISARSSSRGTWRCRTGPSGKS